MAVFSGGSLHRETEFKSFNDKRELDEFLRRLDGKSSKKDQFPVANWRAYDQCDLDAADAFGYWADRFGSSEQLDSELLYLLHYRIPVETPLEDTHPIRRSLGYGSTFESVEDVYLIAGRTDAGYRAVVLGKNDVQNEIKSAVDSQ